MFGLIAGALSALAAGAVAVSKALGVVGLAAQGLKIIGNAVASVAKTLGIIKPETDVEEIGDRALQAEHQGILPENFGSYEAWIKEIEGDEWGYDPEKNREISQREKILKGTEVSAAATMEKFPDLPIADFFTVTEKNQDFFSIDRMSEIGKLAQTDQDAFGKVVNYVTGSAKDHTTVNDAVDLLLDIEKTIEPGISDDYAYDRVASFYTIK